MTLAAVPDSPARVGWCPGALRPMPAGDGLLVRVKPRGNRLSPPALRAVAALSRQHGNGALTLTGRGNLQLRGVEEAGLPALLDTLGGLGLLDATPEGEAVRNVLTSPFCEPDDVVGQAAAGLEERLGGDPALWRLPAKVAWAVDGLGPFALGPVGADVHATLAPDGRCTVTLAGSDTAGAVLPGGLPEAAARLGRAFLCLCDALGTPPHRVRDVVARCGARALLDHAGLPPAAALPVPPPPPPPIGRYRFGDAAGIGAAVPFGLLRAAALDRIAEAAMAAGAATVRLTPWRTVLVPGLADAAALAGAGLVVDADDPRRQVAACVGAPGCRRASTSVPADAARLATLLPRPTAKGILLHVSGCAKGCAHPEPAAVTLVGRDGTYDLVLAGRAGGPFARMGLRPDALATMLAALLPGPGA